MSLCVYVFLNIVRWGTWGIKVSCPNGGFLNSFMLKVQDNQGPNEDDSAANDIQFRCNNTGNYNALKANNGGFYGTWGDWSDICWSGICGIETKVETIVQKDESSLNDVRMYCCPAGDNSWLLKRRSN